MNNKVLVLISIVVLIIISYGFYNSNQWYKENQENQIIECNSYNGDFAPTGVLAGASCLINGEKIRYVNTINGWKLLIIDAYEVEDE